MSTNPYAPPTAHVADVAHRESAPRIWNPNAAANWSLLFSPVFGAILHMKNWDALGEPAKAAGARAWAIAALVLIVALNGVPAMLPDSEALDAASRGIGLILLLAWWRGVPAQGLDPAAADRGRHRGRLLRDRVRDRLRGRHGRCAMSHARPPEGAHSRLAGPADGRRVHQ